MRKSITLFILSIAAVTAFSQPCSDLFISEYLEGSSSNKAIEIFNPTPNSVNLSGYKVQLFTNGSSTAGATFNLNGNLASGKTYVIVNNSANDSIKARRDTISTGVTNFNGNDAVALLKGTTILDVVGVIGVDPGTKWVVGTGSTLDYTLVRADSVHEGTTNWALSALQWRVLPKDTFSNLGNHTISPCGAITDTLVRFVPNAATVSENSGTYDINIALNAASISTTFTVDVVLVGGTGDSSDIGDFTSQSVTFNPNTGSLNLPITITDDTLVEGAETFIFKLRNPSAPLELGFDSVFTLTISPSDNPAQTFTLAQITGLDATGTPDSIGVNVVATGTVYGVNMRPTGLQFTIRDATAGIQVYSTTRNFGYTVTEGDSVFVKGQVDFFNGMTELNFLDTVYKIGTGTLKQAQQVQNLDESTENDLVRLNNMQVVNQSAWTPTGNANGFSVKITDGVDTFELRIDEQVNLFNDPVPVGRFDVIGIGGQSDASSPYTSGYRLFPRYRQDIILINGINDKSNVTSLSVYPNPAKSYFVVRTGLDETEMMNANLFVFDITGRLVASTPATEANVVMNTSTFSKGLYTVQLVSGTKTTNAKISIE
jgi:hypothetical protein